jgi:hypothetical protein
VTSILLDKKKPFYFPMKKISWRQVSQLCILRCFQKAGFKNERTNIDDSESGSDDDEHI